MTYGFNAPKNSLAIKFLCALVFNCCPPKLLNYCTNCMTESFHKSMTTVNRGTFMSTKFRTCNFRVQIFSDTKQPSENLTHQKFSSTCT